MKTAKKKRIKSKTWFPGEELCNVFLKKIWTVVEAHTGCTSLCEPSQKFRSYFELKNIPSNTGMLFIVKHVVVFLVCFL